MICSQILISMHHKGGCGGTFFAASLSKTLNGAHEIDHSSGLIIIITSYPYYGRRRKAIYIHINK